MSNFKKESRGVVDEIWSLTELSEDPRFFERIKTWAYHHDLYTKKECPVEAHRISTSKKVRLSESVQKVMILA